MCTLLNNGIKLPSVGLGTFLLQSPIVEEITESAIKQGYKLIDTAAVYRNEKEIGNILKKLIPNNIRREDIFITSKLSPSSQGNEKSRKAALASLEALQLEYLDLYLIHWPGSSGIKTDDVKNTELRKETWLQMERMYYEDKFKAIGISNYTIKHLKELFQYCTVIPAVLQVEVHPYLTQEELRKFCKEAGIHVQAYSSLGSKDGSSQLLNDPVITSIAKLHKKSEAQILLRWALQHGMSVIPKTSNITRLKENIDIFAFTLSDEQMQMIDNLDQRKHFCWNPENVA